MKPSIIGCTLAVALSATAVSAQDKRPFSFRDLEYRYDAGDAERIGKRQIADLAPTGTSVDAASRSLRDAGARCRMGAGNLVCRYTAFEAVEEMPHDLVWTVTMPITDGRTTGLTAERESLGS